MNIIFCVARYARLLVRFITVPTFFTLVRIALVPFIVYGMLLECWAMALSLFLIAAVTDALDGGLARLLKKESFLGAVLDPVADKILLLSCFITLVYMRFTIGVFFLPVVVLIFLKELFVLCGSLSLYMYKGYIRVKPTILGKTATIVQMILVAIIFMGYKGQLIPNLFYQWMLVGIFLLVCMSLVQYTKIGLSQWFNKTYL